MGKLTILIVNDHAVIREGMRSILQPCSEWEIVAEGANGRLAVEKSVELRPAVAVLDLAMPEMNGLDATRRIREAVPETEVVILTVDDSGQKLREALSCGARAYGLKSTLDAISSPPSGRPPCTGSSSVRESLAPKTRGGRSPDVNP